VEVIELFGLPMEQLQGRLRALPERTVVLAASLQRDGAGRQWSGQQSVPAIVSASSAPLFTPWAHLVGLGTVGGVVTDVRESGATVGRLVLRILAGEGSGALLEAMSGLPEPGRRVRVAARAEGKGVAIRVEDSGPGVPAELVERVFEPFFTTKPGGLGMGLAIIRSIAEAHEGTISLAPAAGGGAAFELVLPATGEPAARRPAAAG
jgi:hypothetical protein